MDKRKLQRARQILRLQRQQKADQKRREAFNKVTPIDFFCSFWNPNRKKEKRDIEKMPFVKAEKRQVASGKDIEETPFDNDRK